MRDDAPDLTPLYRAWEKATRAWSRDDMADRDKTLALGETMLFASIDLISALEDAGQKAGTEVTLA